jgi:hypothetical protein
MNQRLSITKQGVGVSSRLQKPFDARDPSFKGRIPQRRLPLTIGTVGVRVGLEQRIRDLELGGSLVRRQGALIPGDEMVKRGPAITIGFIGRDPMGQQPVDTLGPEHVYGGP